MVDPYILCKNHLLGEHRELHALESHLNMGRQIGGWVDHNCLEPVSIRRRHNQLIEEMAIRGYPSGYHHKTPIIQTPRLDHLPSKDKFARVGKLEALGDLLNRCPACAARYQATPLRPVKGYRHAP